MSQEKRGFNPESARIVKQGVAQLKNPTVKKYEKVLLIVGLVYWLSPIDIIPDVIPFIGYGDDVVVTGGAIVVSLIGIVARSLVRAVQRTVDGRHS
ncbi:MAG: hypothetical protein JWM07_792 [Candidatus Saccharibacteria bacterium]|nr:hypothetical protein [Candidatus Saccharibacteria bacterium]